LIASAIAFEKITVHLVPHSHDDLGWQETLDKYFYIGKNNMLGVNMIITTVIDALDSDEKKRFNWSEMKYFQMWWRD
jgi:hypothetical protein